MCVYVCVRVYYFVVQMNGIGVLFALLTVVVASTQQQPSPPVYGVSMIVRNEIKTLPRLLDSLRPYIRHYEVCDTGSTDGTAEWMQRWLEQQQQGISGRVHRDPWVHFGANRNACLLRLQQHVRENNTGITHILLPDADFELVALNETAFRLRGPQAEYNYIEYTGGASFHSQPLLIGATSLCGYLGRTHEALVCVDNTRAYRLLMGQPTHNTQERVLIEAAHYSPASPASAASGAYADIAFIHRYDGTNRADKFARDIVLLRQTLAHDPNNTRALFYLGQSLENAQRYADAFDAYALRAASKTGDKTELWYSLHRMGACQLSLGKSIDEAARYFVDAYNLEPARREPLYPLTRHYRVAGKYTVAKMYGTEALRVPFPVFPTRGGGAALFVIEKWLYEWAFVDEVSICMHALEDHKGAVRLLQPLLNETKYVLHTLDDGERARLHRNLDKFSAAAAAAAAAGVL